MDALHIIGLFVGLIIGFVLLVKGADFFVDGASAVAKKLKVPSLIIGMTIVAMGTSLPECSVSVNASLTGSTGMMIGNAIGSNIFNLVVVCGLCALFCPLLIDQSTLLKEFPFSVAVALLFLLFGVTGSEVAQWEGMILLVLFVLFIAWMVVSARKKQKEGLVEAEEEYKDLPVWKCVLFIVGGAAAIAFGGDLVVETASGIASLFGMSDTLIGLTIVALGTSLPELATSVAAARKNELDMALGNVIGSNIFNILFVLGVGLVIAPISFNMENVIDICIFVAMSLVVWLMSWKDKKLVRWHGIVMLLMYAAFLVYIIGRVYWF